jgi:hypothetical protein
MPPAAGAGGANQWLVELSGTHGWNYIHVVPGINRRTGATWAANDQVNAGDQLGVVAPFPAGRQSHVHVDYTSAAVDATFGNLLRPTGNPLDYLQALDDTTAPTVSADKIHFRLAADEGAAMPHYFTDTLGGRTVLGGQAQASDTNGAVVAGSPSIDIIADIYDQLQPGGNRLAPYSVWFSLTGMTWGDKTANINPFRFSGPFLGAGQDYAALRTAATVRTVYAMDPYSQSADYRDFWYALTNSPVTSPFEVQPPITAADSRLYWASNVAAGNPWNATDPALVAPRNAAGAFRDDFYTLDVWAYDANGNKGEAQTVVLLDNYVRTISTSAPEYDITDPIIVSTGTQYTANEQVPLYFLTAPPTEGQALGAANLKGNAQADNNGVLQMTNLDSAVHRGFAQGTSWIVADYLRDGTYHAKLDAFTSIKLVAKAAGTPTVTGINPSQGNSAGGTQVTITGSGFTGATRVQFGNNAATNFRVVSDTQITATAPAGQPGSQIDVTVTSRQGTTSATNGATRFTYQNAAPTVTRVTPNTGGKGTIVAITGTNFTGATRVQFGINPATSFTVNLDTEIIAQAPEGQAGATVNVLVTTPWGTSTATAANQRFTYATNAPTVTGVDPPVGSRFGGYTVTITGTNFTGATRVQFGTDANAAAAFTVVNNTTIRATAPPGMPGPPAVDIRVTTPGGQSATVPADRFTYVSTPVVTFVSPNGGLPAGGNAVTITGDFFGGTTAVQFGAVVVPDGDFRVVSDTTIQVVKVPAQAAGTVDVRVTNRSGTSPISSSDRYTYAAAPSVTAVVPNQGLPAGGNTVRITGTNFTGATAVRFGAVPVPRDAVFTVDSPTQITVTAPPQAAGVVDITVTTPSGTSPVVAADRYTYAPAPAVGAINPNQGPWTGGTVVRITGTHFTNATSVRFGARAATNFTVDSATQITATAPPAQTVGAVDVTVTTPSGTSPVVAAGRFTYVPAPTTTTVSAVNPSVFGQTVTFTATVTSAPPGGITPTGTVAFILDGGVVANIALDAAGRARYSTSALAVGNHTVIASFSGDPNFDHSTSAPYTQTVNKADTTTSVGSSANPSNFGQAVTFTATISASGGTPTGSVTFKDGATVLGTGTLNGVPGSDQAAITVSALVVGSHTITAVYGGNGSFTASTSGPWAQTVMPAPLTITANNQTKVFGAAVPALTASYSGFVNGDTPASLTTPPTLSTTATASSPVGTYPITAAGAAAANYAITYVAGTLTVTPASTVTTIAANHPTSVFGEPIVFTARVTAVAPGAGSPTGTVAFRRLFPDGTSVTFGTGPLDAGGTAVFVMDHFVPATATLFAVYQGDGNFQSSTSATITHVINPAATTLSVSSGTPVSVAGQPVNFSSFLGVVALGSPVVPPTGTITFLDTFQGNTTVLSTISVGGSGTSPAFTAAGTHVITAVYSGDGYFQGSTAAAITQTVVAAAAASLRMVPAQSQVFPGQPFSMTVTAYDLYGNIATGYLGTVRFTTTDSAGSVPGSYQFTAADHGVHTFTGFVLRSPQDESFTVIDTLDPSLTSTVFFHFM